MTKIKNYIIVNYMNMENLIYTVNMNREDLSKMTKQQLIDMLLGQKPKTVSAKSAGPVDQTVFKPKTLDN